MTFAFCGLLLRATQDERCLITFILGVFGSRRMGPFCYYFNPKSGDRINLAGSFVGQGFVVFVQFGSPMGEFPTVVQRGLKRKSGS